MTHACSRCAKVDKAASDIQIAETYYLEGDTGDKHYFYTPKEWTLCPSCYSRFSAAWLAFLKGWNISSYAP